MFVEGTDESSTCRVKSMKDLLTAQSQACWKERIRKETVARATWKVNHGHKYAKERPRPGKRPQQQAVFHPALGGGSPPAPGSPDGRTGRTRLPETEGVGAQPPGGVGDQEARRAARAPAGQTKPETLEMRPVPLNTLQLLFQGVSHDGQGRALYLRERSRQKPEDKFQYPILSSWEYGWHLGDAVKNSRTSIYAKCQSIATTFQSKNGVFYVPQRTDQLM